MRKGNNNNKTNEYVLEADGGYKTADRRGIYIHMIMI